MKTIRRFVPLEYHKDHDIEVRRSDKLMGQSYYWCVDCKKWVAWLSKKDTALAEKHGLIKK
jgi:hypothetical protein